MEGRERDVSTDTLLIVLACIWVAIGVVIAVMMGRRGFSPWSWLVVGVVLGPLAVPIAVAATRDRRPPLVRRLSEGTAGTGGIDVLVGIDGSDASQAAARTALSILGPVGRCTLAAVVDRDTASTLGGREERERIRAALETASALVAEPQPATVMLEGKASHELARYAAEEGYAVAVVGRRGRGASKALLGSTASSLARGSEVPVLIV